MNKFQQLNQKMQQSKKQVGAFMILGLTLFVAAIFIGWVHHRHQSTHRSPATRSANAFVSLEDKDFTKANAQSALESQQQVIDQQQKAIAALTKQVAGLTDHVKTVQQQAAHAATHTQTVLSALNARIAHPSPQTMAICTQANCATSHPPISHPVPSHAPWSVQSGQSTTQNPTPVTGWESSTATAPPPPPLSIGTLTFSYPHHTSLTMGRTAKTYVPAGTFVRAILLQGADANASVNGQSNTSPILLRLISRGTLPNGEHSSLTGCFVLASIYGDISSERGEVRLTTLSCTRKDGQILDLPVKGYVSFAGKEGIKGRPVMRNGKIIAWAGASGMLSGIGQAVQQAQTTQSISPLGVTQTIDPSRTLRYGAAAGFGTAMNKLSDYYIKRADQYHPIIEIGAGNLATVVFQQGFSLKKGRQSRDSARQSAATTAHANVMTPNALIKAKIPKSIFDQMSHAQMGQLVKPN